MALVATSLGSADLSVSDVARSVAARIFPFLNIQTTSTLDAIVISVIGVPFFAYLILRTRKEYFQ
ncbi:hypothetical protein C1O63_1538 [Dehalococcoides mccartyi]|uniref:hypothetical protein n=1 Tax=Dehalococcoides mccartyi TaxID=61435 RepID=UPI000CDEF12A|nr:hypothetical protein [Dehalococcoides mccartyi]POZ58491.1 hypothetical protein C1O63_1538 [Dehalococcoides mccartyi]